MEGSENWVGGAQELSARAPGSRPPHRTRKPSVLRKLNWGREARRLQRLSSAGCRPGAGGGAGAWERGRPGPGAARPPAALGAVARRRAAGRADPRGPARRRTLCSSARAGREAPDRSLCPRPAPARRGAARATGGAATAPWKEDRREGRWWRLIGAGDQEAAAETLPPPSPPPAAAAARPSVGGGFAG